MNKPRSMILGGMLLAAFVLTQGFNPGEALAKAKNTRDLQTIRERKTKTCNTSSKAGGSRAR